MYVYRLGFRFFDVGLASAAAIIMVVIAGFLAMIYASRLLKGEKYWVSGRFSLSVRLQPMLLPRSFWCPLHG